MAGKFEEATVWFGGTRLSGAVFGPPVVKKSVAETSANDNIYISTKRLLEVNLKVLEGQNIEEFAIRVQGKNGVIPRSKPRLLKQEIMSKTSVCNDIKHFNFTRRGMLLIVVSSIKCCLEIMKISSLLGVQIESSLQTEGITTRFLLREIPAEMSLAEVWTEIESANKVVIKDIRRFVKKTQSGPELTETVLVTVFGTKIPEAIDLWCSRQRIQIFVDRVRQCLNCFKYDHIAKFCRSKRRCERCAEEHDKESCTSTKFKCCNCHQEHLASDKSCNAWKLEANVLRVKSLNHLTYPEARRRCTTGSEISTEVTKESGNEDCGSSQEILKMVKEQLEETRAMILDIIKNQMELMKSVIVETVMTVLKSLNFGSTDQQSGNQNRKKVRSEETVGENNEGSMDLGQHSGVAEDLSSESEVLDNFELNKFDILKKGGRTRRKKKK